MGSIYEIVCNVTGLRYIGSTIKSLKQRLSGHKSAYKRNKLYHDSGCSSSKVIENGNCNINLLEQVEQIDISNMLIREQYYINSLDCVNTNKACLTEDERLNYKGNKDKQRITKKKYSILNKEYIKERSKQYNIDNKDLIKQRKIQYNIDNKEKYIQTKKDNNERIREHRKQIQIKNTLSLRFVQFALRYIEHKKSVAI